MLQHLHVTDIALRAMIRKKQITFAGNSKAGIYGKLNCRSGKKLLRKNRVFFTDEAEALYHNYRPCGHCMKQEYSIFKTV
ncbi:metal-binding protein [Flavobacterium album]|uniref:Metal-binding protein n=1 Tax=Flavobacterium album TaxID=2175091 RepID=A0A2S1QTG6_9FLAO|nr:Ada metal-binding domain-containing protein [Flavobacterium album]AWH83683.1 metal-binding protein [Flavobacterium album]